ncbi:MAG: hemolysin III family protein [Gammaproteobacteria bacterium]|nr:hemolysin III family protein [Gammaproteobacteria bacterium]
MSKHADAHNYSVIEERINVASHALGLLLSAVGVVLLVAKSLSDGTAIHTVSFTIFGISLVTLYSASTAYHAARTAHVRSALRTFDHASIYLLIAGTYTPFTLVTLQGTVGWVIFGVTWSMALIGITAKLFFTGRFDHLSTAMYVFMGWIIMFAVKPLVANLSVEGLFWLVAGGISYTIGALFYSIKKMPFGHATFHIFVLLGSVCHFTSVYFYVIATPS